jgi:hypothetical protein
MGCVSTSVFDDARVSFVADIEIGAELKRVGSLPEATAEFFLTCSTVDGVASYGIHGGAGS